MRVKRVGGDTTTKIASWLIGVALFSVSSMVSAVEGMDTRHLTVLCKLFSMPIKKVPFASSARCLVQAAYQRSHQEYLRAKKDDISAIVVHYYQAHLAHILSRNT